MLKRLPIIVLVVIAFNSLCTGQETDAGPNYQMIMKNNPALSGIEGNGVVRLSYLNFYPGNNYNLHSVYFSYDSYFPELHGGVGVYCSDDYIGGIVNDIRGGLSYSYFLQASKDLFINAGLSASVYHRGFNFENAVLPDQIDPIGGAIVPTSQVLDGSGQTVFDVGAGFLFISGKYFGGFSVNHLTEPDLSGLGFAQERLKRKVLFHFSGDFNLMKNHNLKVLPVLFLSIQNKFASTSAGAVFESNYLSVNAMILKDNNRNLNIQTGFSVKTSIITVFYNYRFNIVSENKLMPLSLLHQTGLAFSLNNVDKKNIFKTIKFPQF